MKKWNFIIHCLCSVVMTCLAARAGAAGELSPAEAEGVLKRIQVRYQPLY